MTNPPPADGPAPVPDPDGTAPAVPPVPPMPGYPPPALDPFPPAADTYGAPTAGEPAYPYHPPPHAAGSPTAPPDLAAPTAWFAPPAGPAPYADPSVGASFPPPTPPPAAGGYHVTPPPPFRPAPRRSPRRPLLIGGGVLAVVAVLVGAFVLLRDDEPDLQWHGEGIDQPEQTLEDAERAVASLVDERHGALHDEGRCYFSLPEDEAVKDVHDHVRCGPVLFVDGDPEAPYLSFPLSLSGEGDTTLDVGDQPVDPEPTALEPGERLARPDGAEAPEGNGGLEPPEPPPAAEDLLGAIDVGPTTIGTPPEGAKIGSLNASYELTGLGEIDRYGRGDAARRPAEGHKLIAFTVSTGAGEAQTPTATPSVQVQVDDGEPRDVGTIIDGTSPVVMSVPADAGSVDLVVTDADVEQRLSLLDGTPGEGNLQVLTRANRTQTLGTVHQVSVTASDATGSAAVTGTITVEAVHLDWFLYDDPAKRASTPQTAFLVVLLTYAWAGVEPADAGLTNQVFTVVLPDGQVLTATNLANDPTAEALIAIEVPADFTAGTLQIGGVDQQPTGLTVDFGGNVYSTPISIPAG